MTDLVNVYSEYKNKTLIEYMNLISKIISVDTKKIIGNRRKALEIYSGIIDIYTKKYLLITELNYDFSKMFIESDYIDEYNLSKEINAISDYFIKNNSVFDLVNNESEIILIATYLQMALKLDEFTNDINEEYNLNDKVNDLLESYHQIDAIFLIDQGKKVTRELIEFVKSNAAKEKELYESLTDKDSFNKYIKINNNHDKYITQYNYYIKELDKYDSKQAGNMYYEKNIDDDYTLISAEIASATLLKQLQARNKLSTFFIPIKKKFLTKEKNIRDYKKLISSNISNKCIKLLINQQEVTENLVKILNQNKLPYYIYCNKDSKLEDIAPKTKYIFSKEFQKNNENIFTDNNNIILEDINIFKEDKDLIKRDERGNN